MFLLGLLQNWWTVLQQASCAILILNKYRVFQSPLQETPEPLEVTFQNFFCTFNLPIPLALCEDVPPSAG